MGVQKTGPLGAGEAQDWGRLGGTPDHRWGLGDCDDEAKSGRLSGLSRALVLVPLLVCILSTHACIACLLLTLGT